jgi:hypothetical protein
MYVRPSVRTSRRGSHWIDFREIWYLELLLKSVEKLWIWLKSDKNIGKYTYRPEYVLIVDGSTQYFVARKQCVKNPLLNICGNTVHFYIVDSYV